MLREINDKELNPVTKMLKKALNAIEKSFLEHLYSNPNVSFIQKPERVFVAELYHQLRLLQNTYSFDDLSIHVDINKHVQMNQDNPCFPQKPFKRISPDIVLHDSQSNTDKQIMICEVKMEGASYSNIEKDLRKLIFYSANPLSFENTIFIFTGSKITIENFLNRFITSQNQKSMLNCLEEYSILFALPKNKENKTNQWGIYKVELGNKTK